MAFLYPSFLFALAAIAVPIILHLVQLRRAKRVVFSNVKFIQVSKDLTASQRTLKELLILLSRILAITFLVLAFAQPYFAASDVRVAAANDSVALALDNSYSMANQSQDADLPLMSVAADQAKVIADLFPGTTAFKLFSTDKINHGAVVQASQVSGFVENIDFSSKPFNAEIALNNKPAHAFILSDFQKNTFSPSYFNALDSTMQVHLIPLAAANTANITIDSVYLEDEFLRGGAENILHVVLSNTGSEALSDVPVKLYINNQQLAALSIDLPAKQSTEAVMTFRSGDDALQQAYVQVEDYPVEFDNTYYFILKPSGTITIAEIGEAAENSLQRLYGNEPFFRHTFFTEGNVNYATLSAANIVILNGVNSLSSALAASVANYVKAGGTVVVFPPASATQLAGYTALFQSLNLPATINPVSATSAKTSLAAPDPNNPFFKSIFSDFDPKLEMPQASRSMVWSRASEDILKYRGGAPFMSRFSRGSGSVFLMAAPLDEAYTSLPNHALFVPIMYRLAISSYKQEQQLAYSLTSGTVQLPVASTRSKEGVYELKQDTMAFIPEQQVRGGKLYFNVPPAMDVAGFYTLQLQDSVLTTLAFNYSKEESDLEQYTPDELRALVGENRPNVHVYDYGDAFSVKGEFEKRYFGVKLWKYCLILCLFFLMAEIALIRFL
ncbi:BatA domain-containing protein [Pontibacter oryzae]|uniref:BatA domain-containing protein n=1 Tax=Pontibacter oryzae TaxID=2304593 RepID=UPI001F20C673|nr:BatA domain-containing protein [Pontibacter oryzae]